MTDIDTKNKHFIDYFNYLLQRLHNNDYYMVLTCDGKVVSERKKCRVYYNRKIEKVNTVEDLDHFNKILFKSEFKDIDMMKDTIKLNPVKYDSAILISVHRNTGKTEYQHIPFDHSEILSPSKSIVIKFMKKIDKATKTKGGDKNAKSN